MIWGSKSVSFEPGKDIPPLHGKVILVTGGNIGLGKQCVLDFARHDPAQIWLAARSLDRAEAAADEIRQQVPNAPIKLLQLDLASLESVKSAASTFLSTSDRLDILMLNAGIMVTLPGLSTDGYELQFGTNHMGHALLTKLLLPVLEKTAHSGADADVRIVSVSSVGHNSAPKEGIQFDALKTPAEHLGSVGRYGQSKLANILWARRLAALHPQFTVAAIHPGVVRTNWIQGGQGAPWVIQKLPPLARMFLATAARPFLAPVEKGVYNQLWASVSKEVQSGEYYAPVGIGNMASALGKDDNLARKLGDWTEKELEGYAPDSGSGA